jgi:hypothetical protein
MGKRIKVRRHRRRTKKSGSVIVKSHLRTKKRKIKVPIYIDDPSKWDTTPREIELEFLEKPEGKVSEWEIQFMLDRLHLLPQLNTPEIRKMIEEGKLDRQSINDLSARILITDRFFRYKIMQPKFFENLKYVGLGDPNILTIQQLKDIDANYDVYNYLDEIINKTVFIKPESMPQEWESWQKQGLTLRDWNIAHGFIKAHENIMKIDPNIMKIIQDKAFNLELSKNEGEIVSAFFTGLNDFYEEFHPVHTKKLKEALNKTPIDTFYLSWYTDRIIYREKKGEE